ncbi:HlyD family efflux transporter periplasmic adaptor subunit [Rhizobium pusense]|jgi:HlyD family secretion protein|uniref:HlyD family efflux transporter periplasmic adaptor subunit n=1 Tax=Agrobacterium pusense TaxID=648995 RepID=A0A1L9CL36_9HYPH|nr:MULTISPECIES: HlyD family efflux transporter periplasmic adaptor subunit [Rhizobium/Agrobacterium group]ANV25791.1 glycoside hydrolase family 43 [Rhizobium sp. S41]KGE81218.1 glycoside hydrolase family 43 [Rhizobium sp. H41]MDP9730114.1 HlyD family secretion protein [Rhizobium sp. SORGH_AS_0285]MDP9753831.1 HlyD family secretion protein [Rhizobium sp. SORGH_AS_0260]TGR67979.1 HlyD family efflux transporter periplasmic adaptor subunit [bacterium M00.F.Ca.ET.194.01.1.1]TGS54080.1 HlyD family
MSKKGLLIGLAVVVLAVAAYFAWSKLTAEGLPSGFVASNGRIEAVEIDISTKTAGRLQDIMVREGDFVKAGQVLAQMDTAQLEARKRQAEAQLRRAKIAIDTAHSLVAQREAEKTSALAVVEQRKAQLDSASKTNARSKQLLTGNAVSQQIVDDSEAAEQSARATLASAQASLAASDAAINAAKAQIVDAEAAVDAAQADIESIETDIADATLKSPRDGRVQYRIAQPGEVLSAGGRVLNLVDLGDVYMTFFLPTAEAGRTSMGSDVRLILDAAPQYTIPAKVSFVADVAQFTPKTVETEEERQKLTFRVRAQIPQELLQKYIQYVKTGLPGMAYVRLDPEAAWPENLERNLVK